jgi:hypothetical protein
MQSHGFWTLEDELAFYRIVPGAHALEVYSQDVFVRHFSTWQVSVGGVVMSKQPLELDFATNAVQSQCPIWSGIRSTIEDLVIRTLTTAGHLTDSQRKFLGIRFREVMHRGSDLRIWKRVKLLTDPWGEHLPLSALDRYRRFVHIPEPGPLACGTHGIDGTFVVTDALLDRFGTDSLEDWLALLAVTGLLPDGCSSDPGQQLQPPRAGTPSAHPRSWTEPP